jgi:hypothetical protein
MSGWSDAWENMIVDAVFRGQTFTAPAAIYVGLLTAAPSDSGGGTEVSTSGTNYARQSIGKTLAAWAGTQGAGTTTASTGTSAVTSNNNAITFGAPSASWGTVTHFALYDAVTSGTLIGWAALTTSKTINNGDAAPSFAAGSLTFAVDAN